MPSACRGAQASKCLLVLCGLAGAGKTTFALRLRQAFTKHHQQSGDSKDFAPEQWKKARATALNVVEQEMSSAAGEASASQHLIIVDDNMYYRSMRHRCFQLACKHQAAFTQLYVKCPIDIARQRNSARLIQDRVPDEVLLRMHSLLEAPEPHKHVWEASTIVISTEMNVPLSSSNILQEIVERWGGPAVPLTSAAEDEEARKAGQAANQASLLHRLDLQCRRQLSEAMQQLQSRQAGNTTLMAEAAGALNQARQAALVALREADESQAAAVLQQRLAGFVQTCQNVISHSGSSSG